MKGIAMKRLLILLAAIGLIFSGAAITAPIASAGPVYGSACYTSADHMAWDYRMERRYYYGTWCIADPMTHSRLVFQKDGNVVVYAATNIGGVAMWATNTVNRGYLLKFQVDGNVVLNDRAGHVIWAMGLSVRVPPGTYRLFVSGHILQTTWNNKLSLRALYFPGPPKCAGIIPYMCR
jgi:hypothetical protein